MSWNQKFISSRLDIKKNQCKCQLKRSKEFLCNQTKHSVWYVLLYKQFNKLSCSICFLILNYSQYRDKKKGIEPFCKLKMVNINKFTCKADVYTYLFDCIIAKSQYFPIKTTIKSSILSFFNQVENIMSDKTKITEQILIIGNKSENDFQSTRSLWREIWQIPF